MEEIRIIDATPEDADMIAHGIMEAVGEEIVSHMAGEKTREDVFGVFSRLARCEDSQYSYLNTRIALMPDGSKAGVCISYDGGRLIELRRAFFEEARHTFGWEISPEEVDALPGETCEDEYYLDTLMTLPEYRGHGVASALIRDAAAKAGKAGLPLGLLVSDHNPEARRLYDSLGFRPAGRRPFAGEEMTNLRLQPTGVAPLRT